MDDKKDPGEALSSSRMKSCQGWVCDHLLFVLTAVGVVVGLVVGATLSAAGVVLSPDALSWISIWGELYLRMLEMVVLPLVASLIIVGRNKNKNKTFISLMTINIPLIIHTIPSKSTELELH